MTGELPFDAEPPFDRPIRAVVSDIDGTLTTPDRRLSVAGATAIMRLEAVGIPVLLASGNVMPSVRAFALMLGASGPLVAENGGMVAYRGVGWRETIDILADRKVADEAYAALKEQMPEVRPLLTQRWRESEIALEMGPDPDAIREVVKDFPVRIETSGYSIHIIDEKVTKGTGVLHALKLIDIPPEEVLAFGDSENDVTMFEAVGLGVAVSPKEEKLTSIADYVCRWTDGDGVFEAVAKVLGKP
ncbi:MAG: phosphoglycolate phosphatase [Thermoplasmata archaeon]|nr:phosphoglycolate phosphatase [Thermoplasmata archaeon]